MASVMQRAIPLQLLSLIAILCYGVIALPYGCQGTIEVLDVPSFGRYWACAGVELFQGFNAESFLAASTQQDAKTCANYCLEISGPDGLRTGTWNSQDSTCECWAADYPDLPAATPGVTFIDFFAAWDGQHPPAEQNWGVFTCPEGAASGPFGGVGNWCGPLTIEPAQPALAQFGITGICYASCLQYPGFQWLLTDAEGTCNCYGDLAGVKVTLNYSSPYSVADYYDFVPHPTTSTTSITKATSTSAYSAASTPIKSTAKTGSSTTSKSITKSTPGLSSKTTLQTSSKTTAKSSSKISSKASSKSSLKTTTAPSSKSSLKTTAMSSSKTSKLSSKTTASPSK